MLRALAVVLAALALAPAAGATRPLLAVHSDGARFDALTGQQSAGRNLSVGWGQGQTWGSPFADLLARMGSVPILSVTFGREQLSPAAIAAGIGDGYLVALNRALADWGGPVYLRPLAEMTGWWNPYCAYTQSGRSKGAAYSTAAFRAAFRHIYLVVHGRPGTGLAPNPQVQVIWNPQAHGDPQVSGNTPQAYYPGDAYVDAIGDDPYDEVGSVDWGAIERLYKAHPSKPFTFPEWGEKGIDDPTFIVRMAQFAHSHDRVEMLAWWNGHWGGPYDLSLKPRTLAAYRRYIVPLG